jgi:endoglucanase
VSWCIWLYRDLGLQAIVYQPETTAWMQRIKPMLEKKQRLGADAWGSTEAGIHEVMDPIDALLTREFPDYDPYPNGAKREARLLVRHILIAEALLSEYGKAFEGLSDQQVVELAQSFGFDKARRRTRLEAILSGKER